jgi:hypothetical protein
VTDHPSPRSVVSLWGDDGVLRVVEARSVRWTAASHPTDLRPTTYDLIGAPVTMQLGLDAAPADVLAPAAPAVDVDAAPGYLTLTTLRELGACGDYLRTFGRLFPPSTYPTGVRITRELCATYAADFDWSWAASVMLAPRAARTWGELRTSRTSYARTFGTGRAKSAALFGYLFETDAANRSARYVEVTTDVADRRSGRALRQLEATQNGVEHARHQVQHWSARLAELEARLPLLEAAASTAIRRRAERAAEAAAADVVALEERLEAARTAAAEATAAVVALDARTATDAPTDPPTEEAP